MGQPWSAELDVSSERARSLIVDQFPALPLATIEPLGFGWDNTAFLVDGQFVFRFPRRQLGADCLESEIHVLPSLAPLLPLPIPNPTFIGRATGGFPWRFAGYKRIEGCTADKTAPSDAERASAACAMGAFLAELHGTGPDLAQSWNAPPDRLGRLDPEHRIPLANELLVEAGRREFIADTAPYEKLVSETASARPPQAEALVHGDLYARHLLLDRESRLCGIIDWGDVHRGDTALDLSIAHSFLPPAAHDEFRRGYGPITDATWRLARFRALLYGLQLVRYSRAVGDDDLGREALWILKNVLEQ